MRYGRTLPDGFLPIFSVGSEEEAQALLVMACETNLDGEYIARELATDQSMENLIAFGKRLETVHRLFFQFHEGRCQCDYGVG
ncbi:MAG: hypothetical protein IH969_02085 [Candidatus Krumholzibacteriota bacterium]|nr:hypothetical protein [Candidatus Krumholzibacteriota bacterium]